MILYKEELRDNFPYKVVQLDKVEADDIIATIIKRTCKKWFNEKYLIISGDKDFGYEQYYQQDGGKNWTDYQAGLVIGLKIKKWFGLFAEGEYSKLWDKKIYNAKVGFNVNFR